MQVLVAAKPGCTDPEVQVLTCAKQMLVWSAMLPLELRSAVYITGAVHRCALCTFARLLSSLSRCNAPSLTPDSRKVTLQSGHSVRRGPCTFALDSLSNVSQARAHLLGATVRHLSHLVAGAAPATIAVSPAMLPFYTDATLRSMSLAASPVSPTLVLVHLLHQSLDHLEPAPPARGAPPLSLQQSNCGRRVCSSIGWQLCVWNVSTCALCVCRVQHQLW